jgi:hypothetical protein
VTIVFCAPHVHLVKVGVTATALLLALASPLRAQSELSSKVGSDRVSITHVVQDSIRLLAIQHAARIGFQEKTRRELGGHFFGDYRRSVHVPRQWGDADSVVTDYIGHPGQGAASGFIWLQRDPDAPNAFVGNRSYMHSRLRGMTFAAVYSLQFELGPLSEASIGNVGMNPATAGWVDHIMTPVGGLAIMVAEDVLDRYVVSRIERHTGSPILRAVARMLLNPARATANVAAVQVPWYRADRPLQGSGYSPQP